MGKRFGQKDGNKQRFNAISRQNQSQFSMSPAPQHGSGGRGHGQNNFGGRGRGGGRGGRGGRGGSFNSGKFFKNKDQKMIVFDRDKRIEFVTGFKKRKDERRFKAKINAKDELRQERKELLKTKAQ